MRKMVRRSKQVAVQETAAPPATVNENSFGADLDGAASINAVSDVLQALTDLPSDRAKQRVLRFVQDYFDEQHGH